MLDFIMAPAIVGIACAGIYGLFELFVRRKERLAIIEKIGDKLDASAFEGKLSLPSYRNRQSFSALKAGLLLAGIGLGLLIGFFISVNISGRSFPDDWMYRQTTSIIYGASVLLFGGLGLILAFVIELKIIDKELKNK